MAEPKIPGGYYIKSRKIQESAISKQPPHVREIWDYLLRNANHADSILTGGRKIKRGQLFRRYKRIIDDLSWVVGWRKESYNENHVKKAMKFLREALMIDTMKEPGGVLITVLNYDKYQDPKNYERTSEGTNERTIEEPMKNQCVPTYDKKKEEYKEEEIKEGGKNDNVEHMDTDSLNSSAFSYIYKSIKLGHRESDSNRVQEINGQSAEVFCSGNGNGNNSDNQRPCSGTYQDWSDLDDRTNLGIFGQGHNGDIFTGNNGGDLGDSQAIIGLGSQEAMGTQGAQMDRKEDEQEVIINDGMGAQAEDQAKPPQKGAKKERNGIPYQEIITILNECTGKNFRHTTKQTQSLIKARWRDGYTIDDFRRVIEGRSEKWLNDPKMMEYLRPPTLFGNKFEGYLQADSQVKFVLSKNNKKQNLINCNECVHIDTCSNAESEPIPACSLFAIMERATA